VGDNHFVNVASLGLSVGVTEALDPRLKRRLGAAAYPIATVTAYRRHVSFTAWLEFPEGDHEPVRIDDLLQLAVGNGVHYGGGNVMSPTASIDDHLLDVYAIPKGRFRDHVSVARLLRDGSFVEHDTVLHLTTGSVTVRAEPEQRVNVDGEVVTTTPETFTVDRNALDVVVPPGSTAARRDLSRPRGVHVREV
jgi:diacylglycerol kinase (ATP)